MLAPIDVSLSHYLKGGRYYAEDFHCSSVCNCHVSWIGSRNPCAQAHDGGLRRGPAGDCEMPLRYGSRCRANNLREGAMVPLHGTCLLEVRAPVGRRESGGLILSHWPSTPVTSQYSPLKLFTPRARRSCQLGDDGWRGSARFLKSVPSRWVNCGLLSLAEIPTCCRHCLTPRMSAPRKGHTRSPAWARPTSPHFPDKNVIF